MSKEKDAKAKRALTRIYDERGARATYERLERSREVEQSEPVSYTDMLVPGGSQFHPTSLAILGQVNQALTGYGCISVYGPQIFELLGFSITAAEHITMANYVAYFLWMTPAWMLIDRLGRRVLMLWGSAAMAGAFLLLTIFGALVLREDIYVPIGPPAIAGVVSLFISTAAFGIGWLTPPWLIPTEIYPSPARAKGAAISVITWGVANFAVTFLSPILFNNLEYWIFLVFAGTNSIAGLWTWIYSPETGGRSFEQNAQFFLDADEQKTWRVHKVDRGKYLGLPKDEKDSETGEQQPLLGGR